MDEKLILKALKEAYGLVCSEYDSVCDDDLRSEYEQVIDSLEKAIEEME